MKKLFAILVLSVYSLLVFGQWYDFIGNLQFDTAVSVPAQSRGLMFYEGTDSDSLSYFDGVGLNKVKQYEGDRSLTYAGYADLYDASGLTYGNNAVFGDGAGGTAPVKSVVTTEFIDGNGSFKVVGASQNDWIGLDVVPVEEVQDKAIKHIFEMKYRSTVSTDWQERVRCGSTHHIDSTNAAGLDANNYRIVADFVVEQATASCKVGLQCVNAAGCSDILFTKMRVDDEQNIVKSFNISEMVAYTGLLANGGQNEMINLVTDRSGRLMTRTTSGPTRVTFLKDTDFIAVGNAGQGTGTDSYFQINWFDSLGTLKRRAYSDTNATIDYGQSATLQGEAVAGDYLEVQIGLDSATDVRTNFTVKAEAVSDGTVYAGQEGSQVWAKGTLANFNVTGVRTIMTGMGALDDADGIIDSANNRIVVKEQGLYKIEINSTIPFGSSFWANVALEVNGSYISPDNAFANFLGNTTSGDGGTRSITLPLNKNDTLRFGGINSGVGATMSNITFTISKSGTGIDNYIIENPQGEDLAAYILPAPAPIGYNVVTGTTSYKTRVLDSLSGNSSIVSISSNQFTLGKGSYDIEIPVGSYDGAQWLDVQIYNISTASVHETFQEIAFSNTLTVSWGVVKTTLELSESQTFEIRTKAQNSFGSEFLGRVKLTKNAKSLGIDLAKQVVTNHVLGGVEYEVKGKLWNGKQVYARSWETSINMTPDTLYDIATTDTNLEIIRIECYGKTGTVWYHMESSIATNTRGFVRYASDTGNIRVVNGGANFTQQRTTIEYVK